MQFGLQAHPADRRTGRGHCSEFTRTLGSVVGSRVAARVVTEGSMLGSWVAALHINQGSMVGSWVAASCTCEGSMAGFWDAAHRDRTNQTGPTQVLEEVENARYVVVHFPDEAAPEGRRDVASIKCEVRQTTQLLPRTPRVVHENVRVVQTNRASRLRQRRRQGSDGALPKHIATHIRHRERGHVRALQGHGNRVRQDDDGETKDGGGGVASGTTQLEKDACVHRV